MLLTQLPGIRRAALVIAYDNGMINAQEPEDAFLASVEEVLGAEGVTDEDLHQLDSWLQGLPEEELEVVCVGEAEEMATLVAGCPLGGPDEQPLVWLLDDIFDRRAA